MQKNPREGNKVIVLLIVSITAIIFFSPTVIQVYAQSQSPEQVCESQDIGSHAVFSPTGNAFGCQCPGQTQPGQGPEPLVPGPNGILVCDSPVCGPVAPSCLPCGTTAPPSCPEQPGFKQPPPPPSSICDDPKSSECRSALAHCITGTPGQQPQELLDIEECQAMFPYQPQPSEFPPTDLCNNPNSAECIQAQHDCILLGLTDCKTKYPANPLPNPAQACQNPNSVDCLSALRQCEISSALENNCLTTYPFHTSSSPIPTPKRG